MSGAATAAVRPARRRLPGRDELAWPLLVAGVLVLLGPVVGAVWEAVSPPGPLGVRLPAGIQADESEAFARGDSLFALIAVGLGLAAGLLAWSLRRARGPWTALALAVGGTAGSLLAALVGHLLRGPGAHTVQDGTTYYAHLPLQVHMTGALLLEPVAALLVYLVATAFAARDDLGRPDPSRPAGPGRGPAAVSWDAGPR